MVTQALSASKAQPKRGLRAESRSKMSEGLKRKIMSPKMRAASPAILGKIPIQVEMQQESPLSSVGGEAGIATPPLVVERTLPEASQLSVYDPGDQATSNGFEMEQDDGLQEFHERLSGIEEGFKVEIYSLMEKLNTSQAENARLKATIESELNISQAESAKLKAAIESELNISQAENARLKAVESEAYKAFKAYEREKQELKDQLHDAQTEKHKLESSVSLAAIHYSVLEREQGKLVAKFAQSEFENERLRSTNEDINRDMDSLKADYRRLQDIQYTEIPNLETKLEEVTRAKDEAASIVTGLAEYFRCGICHDVLKGPVVLSCNHMFCSKELRKWRDYRQVDDSGNKLRALEYSCPTCRNRVTIAYKIYALYGFNNMLKAVSNHMSE